MYWGGVLVQCGSLGTTLLASTAVAMLMDLGCKIVHQFLKVTVATCLSIVWFYLLATVFCNRSFLVVASQGSVGPFVE